MDSLSSTLRSSMRNAAPSLLAIALQRPPGAPAIALSFLLLLGTPQSALAQPPTIEHPGIVHKDDDCSSCHLTKVRGKSVHSAMALPCTVCHLAETQGDMTTLTLFMPKEKICSGCHDKSGISRRCEPAKQPCLGCHDIHSSAERGLLRPSVGNR